MDKLITIEGSDTNISFINENDEILDITYRGNVKIDGEIVGVIV